MNKTIKALKAKSAKAPKGPSVAKPAQSRSTAKASQARDRPAASGIKAKAAAGKPVPAVRKAAILQGKPAAAPAKPTDAKAKVAKPTRAKPAKAKPAEAKPTEAKPTEAKPTEAKPTEAKAAPMPVTATAKPAEAKQKVGPARLTLSSRNYSSWSLRGWLLTRFAGLKCEEVSVEPDHPHRRAELLLLSPSILVPILEHEGLRIWDVLAIAEYLHERFPQANLLPNDPHARARCRSICGEIHSGFSALRSALPMNLRMRQRQFKVWSRAQADIDRVFAIWSECLKEFGGPYLFGARSVADAMYAPVVTRLRTYDVAVPPELAGYCAAILAMPEMKEWEAAAAAEPDQLEEFDVEF